MFQNVPATFKRDYQLIIAAKSPTQSIIVNERERLSLIRKVKDLNNRIVNRIIPISVSHIATRLIVVLMSLHEQWSPLVMN